MQTDVLLRAENVSKKFCRSLRRSMWYGLNDIGSELLASKNDRVGLRPQEFWALNDISFNLRRGDSLALIGPNGAGKSTLLKIITGLIKPTTGVVEVRGRVQALIALGVGFSPVLTGRENIYIAAAVLGMSKKETDRLYDPIVEFSGIGEFIDSPVQSYSSGMAVRLGFSVAAHMKPDILLVDEVLAVGDDQFRRKAIARMYEMLESATVVFVSHNMNHVEQLCNRAIYLRSREAALTGSVDEMVAAYMEDTNRRVMEEFNAVGAASAREGSGEVRFTEVELQADGKPANTMWSGSDLTIRAGFDVRKRVDNPIWFIAGIQDPATGTTVLTNGIKAQVLPGRGVVEISFPKLTLRPRTYPIQLVISEPAITLDRMTHAAAISVLDQPGRDTNYSAVFKHDLLYWSGPCRILKE